MKIQFSPELIKALATYLDIYIGELHRMLDFTYSKIYLYKVVDNTVAVNSTVNDAFNRLWNDLELEQEDLDNIYSIIDLIKLGSAKERHYRIKKHRKGAINI